MPFGPKFFLLTIFGVVYILEKRLFKITHTIHLNGVGNKLHTHKEIHVNRRQNGNVQRAQLIYNNTVD